MQKEHGKQHGQRAGIRREEKKGEQSKPTQHRGGNTREKRRAQEGTQKGERKQRWHGRFRRGRDLQQGAYSTGELVLELRTTLSRAAAAPVTDSESARLRLPSIIASSSSSRTDDIEREARATVAVTVSSLCTL